jgi:carbonic anhydrase/acetyltransferase-like protein (isoleucine patch superfamily)
MTQRPDITIAPFKGIWPRIHESAFIAPGCRIIGDVEIGPDVSIWYNCVIRGDANHIRIGARSNIQDGSVVHCDPQAEPSRRLPHADR